MPWHIESDNPDCTGFAVVKDDDGTIEGCHTDEQAAADQLAALSAAEDDLAAADALEVEEIVDPELVAAVERAFPQGNPRNAMGRETRGGRMEVRREADGSATVFGYASTFDDPYSVTDFIGEYTETVRKGAFTKTLNDGADVRFYVNHEGVALARTTAGNLDVREDDIGLAYEARLDTRIGAVNDLVILMESGTMRESSFAFQPVKQRWNEDYTERELLEMQLFDVSVVSTPANPNTSAGVRALQALVSELRQGKVLSTKNEALIRDVVDQLATLLKSLDKADESKSRDSDATMNHATAVLEIMRRREASR